MAVKYCGVVLVPIESSLAQAFETLGRTNRLWYKEEFKPFKVAGKDAIRQQPALIPEELGFIHEEGYQKFFVLDTVEGRKIVLAWEDKTVPVIDWQASEEDIEAYCGCLQEASKCIESKIKRGKSKAYLRRWRSELKALAAWEYLIREALSYRKFLENLIDQDHLEMLLNHEVLFASDLDSDTLATKEEALVSAKECGTFKESINRLSKGGEGLKLKRAKFNLRGSLKDIHVVGDAYYYKDLKICNVETSLQKLREYANACSRQSRVATLKYRVTGSHGDRDYAIEKELKAKIDGSLIFLLVKLAKGRQETALSRSLLDELSERLGKDKESLVPFWRASSLKAYREFHELNGRWRPPLSIEELLAQDVSGFDIILSKYKSSLLEFRETEPYKLVECEFESYLVNDNERISSPLLECYLPVEEVYKSGNHTSYYRNKEAAEFYYREGLTVLR